jgi:xanthine dehydrogenase accessory factor
MKRVLLDLLLEARAAKRPLALVTDLTTGRQALFCDNKLSGDLGLGEAQVESLRRAIAADRSGALDGSDDIFVQVVNPPLRMVVVGAVHIAQTLVPMATLAGYEVIVVDPRRAWATTERFPGVTLTTEWPDDALTDLSLDRRSAVVTLTHDPKLDDPALAVALRSEVFYIGALGSKRTHGSRLERLRDQGFKKSDLARIHGPVGLALGARSPAEIAVSILAQVTQTLHQAPARRTAQARG